MNKNILFKLSAISLLFVSLSGYAQEAEKSSKVDLGFGISQDKTKSTASIETISGDELRKSAAINLQDALYGKLLGLTALKTGGFEGDSNFGASLNIRGHQSSSENKVLVLVDGFERPIDRISLEEIESVSVLKDAAATALYGYRGLGGVVLVRTKQGASGRTVVNVNYTRKASFDPLVPDFVDAPTYAKALNEARLGDGLTPAYNRFEINAFENNTHPFSYANVDWQKEVLRSMGSEDQLNFSVSGGTDAIRHYTLFNYESNRGLLSNSDNNDGYSTQLKSSKANIRVNLDFNVTKTTLVELKVMGSFVETNRPYAVGANDVFKALYSLPASAFPMMTKDSIWGGNTTYGASNLVANSTGTGYRKSNARTLFADIKLTQDLKVITSGLSASLRAGYDNYSEIYEDRSRGYKYANTRLIFDNAGNVTDEVYTSAGDMTNNLNFNRWLNSQWRRSNFVASIDYDKQFGDHKLNTSVFYNSEIGVNNGRYNKIHRANWMAYANYGYKDKYIANVVLAATGSNRSYPNKWDFSPTLSLAWVISNEDFMKDSKVISSLKLRGSAGILHTDYIPRADMAFQNYGDGGAGDYYFGAGYNQIWGFYMAYQPNANFNHETAYKYNLGLDMVMRNGLSITAEAYFQRRDNIIQSGNGINSQIFGIPSAYINKGVVNSKGIELGVNYMKAFGEVTLNVGGMFTYGTNEVMDMVETPQAYSYLSKIGKSVYQQFGLEAIGIFKDANDIKNSLVQEFDVVKPGDLKYKDQNGDQVINENDVVAMPYSSGLPEINYSFNLGVEYKGFGINALFQGASNYNKYLNTVGAYTPMVNNANLSQYYLENCWRQGEDNGNAIFPRLTSQNSPNNYRSSTVWFADASFLKLRHCQFYYNVPNKFLAKTFIKGAKIFVKGENLLSFDKFEIMDPEVTSTAYPTLKSVSIGASLTF